MEITRFDWLSRFSEFFRTTESAVEPKVFNLSYRIFLGRNIETIEIMLYSYYDNNIGRWFEPRGISYLFGVIVQMKVVFRKTVVGD